MKLVQLEVDDVAQNDVVPPPERTLATNQVTTLFNWLLENKL